MMVLEAWIEDMREGDEGSWDRDEDEGGYNFGIKFIIRMSYIYIYQYIGRHYILGPILFLSGKIKNRTGSSQNQFF